MSRTSCLAFALLLAGGLISSSCTSDDSPEGVSEMAATTSPSSTIGPTESTPSDAVDEGRPVVIDTDMSVEGAMAILYLLLHPDVRVVAVTVSGTGLVSCREGVGQALGLVALAQAADIPVACGPSEPLSGDNSFPASFRTNAGALSGVLLPVGGEPSDLSAPELLASVIAASEQPIAVYADGPLTNLGLMFNEDPMLADNIDSITLMGGAVDVAGNTFDNPAAEWNIWVDPVAATRVLGSGAPITIVPLDATNAVPLTSMHVSALEQHQSTPIAETVFKLVRGITGLEQGFIYLWDQLNAAVLTDESLVTLEDRPIAVTTEGGDGVVGSTVIDPAAGQIRVAVDADREAFERTFFSTLLGEPFEPVDLSPDVIVSFDGENWSHDVFAELPLGPVVISFENRSGQEAGTVILWLLDDATVDDLDAWDSVEQPPFVEIAGAAFAGPDTSVVTVGELTQPGMNFLVGLTSAPDSVARLATFDGI